MISSQREGQNAPARGQNEALIFTDSCLTTKKAWKSFDLAELLDEKLYAQLLAGDAGDQI